MEPKSDNLKLELHLHTGTTMRDLRLFMKLLNTTPDDATIFDWNQEGDLVLFGSIDSSDM